MEAGEARGVAKRRCLRRPVLACLQQPTARLFLPSLRPDEHCDIREWVLHHASIGVGKFYLFDTQSDPPMQPVLDDLIASGLVGACIHSFIHSFSSTAAAQPCAAGAAGACLPARLPACLPACLPCLPCLISRVGRQWWCRCTAVLPRGAGAVPRRCCRCWTTRQLGVWYACSSSLRPVAADAEAVLPCWELCSRPSGGPAPLCRRCRTTTRPTTPARWQFYLNVWADCKQAVNSSPSQVSYHYLTNDTREVALEAPPPGRSINWQRPVYSHCLERYGPRHAWMGACRARLPCWPAGQHRTTSWVCVGWYCNAPLLGLWRRCRPAPPPPPDVQRSSSIHSFMCASIRSFRAAFFDADEFVMLEGATPGRPGSLPDLLRKYTGAAGVEACWAGAVTCCWLPSRHCHTHRRQRAGAGLARPLPLAGTSRPSAPPVLPLPLQTAAGWRRTSKPFRMSFSRHNAAWRPSQSPPLPPAPADRGGLALHWQFFSFGRHVLRPPGGVLASYTACSPRISSFVKSIVQPKYATGLQVGNQCISCSV